MRFMNTESNHVATLTLDAGRISAQVFENDLEVGRFDLPVHRKDEAMGTIKTLKRLNKLYPGDWVPESIKARFHFAHMIADPIRFERWVILTEEDYTNKRRFSASPKSQSAEDAKKFREFVDFALENLYDSSRKYDIRLRPAEMKITVFK